MKDFAKSAKKTLFGTMVLPFFLAASSHAGDLYAAVVPGEESQNKTIKNVEKSYNTRAKEYSATGKGIGIAISEGSKSKHKASTAGYFLHELMAKKLGPSQPFHGNNGKSEGIAVVFWVHGIPVNNPVGFRTAVSLIDDVIALHNQGRVNNKMSNDPTVK